MFIDMMPQYALAKLRWYETSDFNMALLLGCVLIFLSVIPVSLFRLVRERRPSGARNSLPRGTRAAYWIILGISILNLLVLVAPAWGATGGIQNELLDFPLIMKVMLGMGVLSALLTVGALVYTGLAWKNGYWGIVTRSYYTLAAVAAVAFVWFMDYWNMLGWRF